MLRRYVPLHALNPTERITLLAAWVAGVAQGFAQSHTTNTLPFSRLEFGLDEAQMATVLAITRAGALAALFVAMIADRRGRRGPMVGAFTVLVLSAGATGWVQTSAQFTVVQTVMRGASATVAVLLMVLIAETFRPGFRAFGLGIYAAAASLGAGLSVLALPIAEGGPDAWRTIFQLSLIGLVAVPLLVIVPILPVPVKPSRAIWRPLAAPHAASFWPLAGAALGVAAFAAVHVGFAQERFFNDLDLSAATVVPVTLIAGTLGGVGFFLGGSLADRFGRRPVSMATFALTLVGGVLMYRVSSIPLIALTMLVASLGAFAAGPAVAAHRNELFPTEVRASAVAWITNVTVLGSVIGRGLAGVLIDRLGLPNTVLALGLGVVAAILLTAGLAETRGRMLMERG